MLKVLVVHLYVNSSGRSLNILCSVRKSALFFILYISVFYAYFLRAYFLVNE